MNRSEEMMKVAGVEPQITMGGVQQDNIIYDCCMIESIYPDFTPEKQLEIIKLISINNKDDECKLAIDKDGIEGEYCLLYRFYGGDDTLFYKNIILNTDFTQALAELTTELIKSNELDKQEVKRILER